jgi:uncharacterized protein YsxB (DUF464 family)
MDKPIDIPANLYEDEVVCFMADRYRTTTERVMQCFLVQEAGVSALVINFINSAEELCHAEYSLDTDEETGMIDYRLDKPATGDVALLMDSMILGLKGIQRDYGNEYIILDFKEV